jgi:hypothetical protein
VDHVYLGCHEIVLFSLLYTGTPHSRRNESFLVFRSRSDATVAIGVARSGIN